MQEQHPTTQPKALTQSSFGAWSEQEMLRLTKMARRPGRKADLLLNFPGRTIGAIRVKLAQERKRLGISVPVSRLKSSLETTILDRNDPGIPSISWQERTRPSAERANAAYLAALQIAA